MLHHTVPADVDTRVWNGTRDPALIAWLGKDGHHFDGTQLVVHTTDGDIYPEPGWTIVRWPDGDFSLMSSRAASKRLRPGSGNLAENRARAALSATDQPGDDQDAPVDWQAIAEQRERELRTVGEARRRAEMAIARVRLIKKAPSRSPYNLHANAQDDGWDQALDAVHGALAAPERCETKNARKDHPVHELLAALEAGIPHPDPVGLIGRYYQAIHELCCPYDHTEPRPGHAAAANRATLDEPK
ncbi:hypothetical protein [Streptomyces neyagawaensis]|uniref:hypothetical protein n=1 Tax=Streptomyces neyagawaensis TaxID=42238 RepID=UPI0006E46C03|nr:hypothetical protein [Streptomyces neyagawaensis]MCL6733320.1 hypothetical protein [Streptomyces neyagawaensis]MDE1685122.1 hypothetical protein [Streptomyces neyagawaensis]